MAFVATLAPSREIALLIVRILLRWCCSVRGVGWIRSGVVDMIDLDINALLRLKRVFVVGAIRILMGIEEDEGRAIVFVTASRGDRDVSM
ncbi:hypothetical protein Tco_0365475 [Tanacetum coccineum]